MKSWSSPSCISVVVPVTGKTGSAHQNRRDKSILISDPESTPRAMVDGFPKEAVIMVCLYCKGKMVLSRLNAFTVT